MMSPKSKNLQFSGKALAEKHRLRLEELGFNVTISKPFMPEEELIESLQDVDAHILCGAEKFTANVLAKAPRLRVISFFGVGYETYIDAEAATLKGIAVTNAPGANSQSVAELSAALMLDAVKRTPNLVESTRQGLWKKKLTWDLKGRTLGIIGMGEIGRRFASIANHGFGMNILYNGRSQKPEIEESCKAEFVSLEELMKRSDVVSLHAIETKETRGMIGAEQLAFMQPHSVLINTARAALVDMKALYKALADDKIACAAFDCYHEEPAPKPEDDKIGLLKLPSTKFLLLPHAGFFSEDAADNTTLMAIENITAVFDGTPVPNLVNPDYVKHIRQSVT